MTNHQSKSESSSTSTRRRGAQMERSPPLRLPAHLLLLLLLLATSLLINLALCLPNHHQQQQQRIAAEIDKQLLRKALDETSSMSRGSPEAGGGSSSSPTGSSSSSSTSASASASQSAPINFQCPEQFGYYTDTRDCTKYYVCVFGEVLHESCTGGLRFSRELQTCDWPRNVDCPQQLNNANISSSSAIASPSTTPSTSSSNQQQQQQQQQTLGANQQASSTPFATTQPTSTTSSGLLQDNRPHLMGASSRQQLASESSEEREGMKGPPVVFADEDSDPQQPSFDEAVSPVITPDGTIHLHDGSGGTFGLQPNHNREQQPQAQDGGQGHNVDVFVKPLISQHSNSRARQQQPQQQPINGRQVGPQLRSLQAANLPAEHRLANEGPPSSQKQTLSVPMNNEADKHYSGVDVGGGNGDDEQPVDGEPASSADEQPVDSLAAQADQSEASENQPESPGSNLDSADEGDSSNTSLDERLPAPQPGYIPPVMAQAPARPPTRQTSQLLTVNNRQVAESPSRPSSFKPILITPPTRGNMNQQHQQQQPAPAENQFQNNQRSSQQFSPRHSNQTTNQSLHKQSLTTNQFNANPSHKRQQQQQLQLVAQSNRPSRTSQTNSGPQNSFAAAAGGQQQASRQASRQAFFLPSDQSQSMPTNNVNFNDSSKLIRLQAAGHQFEPFAANSGNNEARLGSNTFRPKFSSLQLQPATPSSSPSPTSSSATSARSQNVLFSQQPFGFVSGANQNLQELQQAGKLDHQGGLLIRGHPGGHQVIANINNDQSTPLMQQQRRPRPPKRQQIPSGSHHNSLRPGQQQQQQRHLQSHHEENPGLTTTPISIGSTTSLGGTNLPPASGGNSFLSPLDISDGNVEMGRGNDFQQANVRPIVAPTTVDFRQQQDTPSGNRFAAPQAGLFSTASPASTRSRQTDPRAAVTAAAAAGQGQSRNAQVLAATELPTLDESLGTTLANEQVNNQTPPATATTAGGSNSDQDPQLVANRYLNSAIDALEAGQPFGTVDYDFDILNDNSTERRNPVLNSNQFQQPAGNNQSSAANGGNNNNNSNNNNGNNANRARPRQPLRSAGSLAGQSGSGGGGGNAGRGDDGGADSDDADVVGGEDINLSNGQANGQIGFDLRGQPVAVGTQQPARQQQQQRGPPASQQPGRNQQVPVSSPSSSSSSSSSSNNNNNSQQTPTKKPRPTNKKISVNHEQALANNRASIEPAKRPEALFATPSALQTATKCDSRACKLPDCKCGDTLTPGGLEAKVIPQVILLTFDDAVNDLNWEIYEELFTGRTNPNGCPILATFYVSHEWTDYGQVQTLYSRGHEMASHSVTHSFGEKFSKSQWFKEVNGQREILNMYGGVKMNDVRGMRAPFLQIGGNKMFEMLYDANFTYDSSMPIFDNSPPLWPYTLDYQMSHECMITPCPTKSFPGVWEVGMTMWVDLRGGRCSMGDACSNPADEEGVYEMLMKNFNRHYKSNRAPFGLFYHSAWFNTVHHRRGFLKFLAAVNSLSDVYFVTNWQMLQWMRKPTPLSEINSFEPWQCPAKNDRPPPCFHPSVCNVKSEHGTRFMKTCQPCPANQQYPWVGSTGFKGKQQTGSSGSG